MRKVAFSWQLRKLMWDKDVTDFLRFCYLTIPCLKINITIIFMLSSSYESMHITRIKTQKQMFPLVSSGHICTPPSIQSRINLGKYLAY